MIKIKTLNDNAAQVHYYAATVNETSHLPHGQVHHWARQTLNAYIQNVVRIALMMIN